MAFGECLQWWEQQERVCACVQETEMSTTVCTKWMHGEYAEFPGLSLYPIQNGSALPWTQLTLRYRVSIGLSMEDKACGQRRVIIAQEEDAERGWGRRKTDFSLWQRKGWKGREGGRRSKSNFITLVIKSRVCVVLKHIYRPILSVWGAAVYISTAQLTSFA